MNPVARKLKFGEALVQEGILSPEQLSRALAAQKGTGRMLGEMLVEQGVISGANLVHVLGRTLGVRGCQLRHGLIDPTLLKLIGAEEAERLLALPMFKVRNTLTVAMTEPQALPKIDRLRQLTGCKVRTVLALEPNIREYIKKYATGDTTVDAFLSSLSEQDVVAILDWCGAENVTNMQTLSDVHNHSFGQNWGVLIEGLPLSLLSRAVFVVDKNGTIAYAEYVPEVTNHPNYEAALAAVKTVAG